MTAARRPSRSKLLSILLTAVVLSYMGMGIARVARAPVLGVMFCPGYEICRVYAGSPAEKAGMRLGDRIRGVDGSRIKDVGPLGSGPALPGQVHTYEIERAGALIELEVRLEPPSPGIVYLRLAPSLVGLIFLLTGLYVSLRRPSAISRVLLWLGLCVGCILSYPPWTEGPGARFVSGAFEIAAWFGFASSIVYLFWLFPRRKRLLRNHPSLASVLFGLAGLAAATLMAALGSRLLLGFDIPHRLHVALDHLAGGVIIGCFLVAVGSFLHSYFTAPPGPLKGHLRLVMAGSVLGLAPVALYMLWFAVNPRRELPLEGQVVLLSALIPLSLGYSILHLPAEEDPVRGEQREPRQAK